MVRHPEQVCEAVERRTFWSRTLRSWDIGFAGFVLVSGVGSIILATTTTRTIAALALAAVIAAAYTWIARPAALRGSGAGLDAYLAILLAATAASTVVTSSGYLLLFVTYSHIWYFSRSRWAGIGWSAAVVVLVVGATALNTGGLSGAFEDNGASMLASFAFSLACGLWITQVIQTSEERAALIDELTAAQSNLAASERAAGTLAERERLAQEIHDTLAQGFTSVVMLAQTAAVLLDGGRIELAAERVDQIEQVARDNLAEARALVAAFGPAVLQGATLGQAIERLADRFTAETHVRVELDVEPGVEPDADAAVVLLRTAQEALANIRRHAGATVVHVRLARTGDDLVLEVGDDGRGLPDDLAEGVGLTGIRERAAAGGGRVELGTHDGAGTRLQLTLPVDA